MYHTIVRRQVQKSFAHLNQHNYQPVVASFTPDIHHHFAGDHALGGTRHSAAVASGWYERLFRLFPDVRFTVKNIVVSGLPHNTRVAIQFRVDLAYPGGKPYFNEVAQFITLKWGRIAHMELYEDTEKLVGLLNQLRDSGISEAAAAPIIG